MTEREPGQLPDALRDLLDAERSPPAVADAVRQRLAARVMESVGGPSVVPVAEATAVGAKAGVIGKLLAALLVAGGAATWALWPAPDGSEAETASTAISDTTSLSSATIDPSARPAAEATKTDTNFASEEPATAPAAVNGDAVDNKMIASPKDEPTPTVVDIQATQQDAPPAEPADVPAPGKDASATRPAEPEHIYITAARDALRRDDFGAAEVALNRHRRAWPRGLLGEERDVLAIRLSVATHNGARARRQLAAFTSRYPNSYHLAGLITLVGD